MITTVQVTEIVDAFVVFILSPTVGDYRAELQRNIDNVNQVSANSGWAAENTEKLEELERFVVEMNLTDDSIVIRAPYEFHYRNTHQKLPKAAVLVGWLDKDGYRACANGPVPSQEWLNDKSETLASWCEAWASNAE